MKIMVGFRASKEFKDLLEKLAKEDNRSLSSFIFNALVVYLRIDKSIDWKEPSDNSK